jgi:hypothetical protein
VVSLTTAVVSLTTVAASQLFVVAGWSCGKRMKAVVESFAFVAVVGLFAFAVVGLFAFVAVELFVFVAVGLFAVVVGLFVFVVVVGLFVSAVVVGLFEFAVAGTVGLIDVVGLAVLELLSWWLVCSPAQY